MVDVGVSTAYATIWIRGWRFREEKIKFAMQWSAVTSGSAIKPRRPGPKRGDLAALWQTRTGVTDHKNGHGLEIIDIVASCKVSCAWGPATSFRQCNCRLGYMWVGPVGVGILLTNCWQVQVHIYYLHIVFLTFMHSWIWLTRRSLPQTFVHRWHIFWARSG